MGWNWKQIGRGALDVVLLGVPILWRWLRGGRKPSTEEILDLAAEVFWAIVHNHDDVMDMAEAIVLMERRAGYLAELSGWVWGEREAKLVRDAARTMWEALMAERWNKAFAHMAHVGEQIVDKIDSMK